MQWNKTCLLHTIPTGNKCISIKIKWYCKYIPWEITYRATDFEWQDLLKGEKKEKKRKFPGDLV